MKHPDRIPLPMPSGRVLDMSFLENRARLLEIAAFLDRLERTSDSDAGRSDYRYRAFMEALRLLLEPAGEYRVQAIQGYFSDPTGEPIESAAGLKAHGAWDGSAP